MKKRKRFKKRNYHHLVPRSRHGWSTDDNVLLIHIERHEAWHTLFGNRTLDEVIELLLRVKRRKEGLR